MKVGVRKPSVKKSVKARTTGAMKRKVKSSINPFYGKKGMGLINDPKKAVYNAAYNRTTFDIRKTFNKNNEHVTQPITGNNMPDYAAKKNAPIILLILAIILGIIGIAMFSQNKFVSILMISLGIMELVIFISERLK